MKIQKVALLGAGAVGSYVLWGLQSKKDLELCVVAEGERNQRLKETGFWINDVNYHLPVATCEEAAGADLLIVTTKYASLLESQDIIRRIVKEHTIVMSLMNGVDSEEIIARTVGAEHLIYSLIKIASHRDGNQVHFDPETTIGMIFGELEAPFDSERVRAVAELFDGTGLHYRVTDNIMAEIWSKFRLNVTNNLPQAILGAGVGCYSDSTHMRFINLKLKEEVDAIATAKGIDLSTITTTKGCPVAPSQRYSTLQDLDNGRHTEIDMFSGAIVKMGKELDIPTPYNEFVFHIIKAMEEKNDGKFDYSGQTAKTASAS